MVVDTSLQEIARLSGAEHEHQYMHGGCPECGIFYSEEFDWQHKFGCSRATAAEPARLEPRWKRDH